VHPRPREHLAVPAGAGESRHHCSLFRGTRYSGVCQTHVNVSALQLLRLFFAQPALGHTAHGPNDLLFVEVKQHARDA
jgi:hypothetical protein